MTDDSELLRRYANDRSEAAFAELVRRHVDLVYSAALRQTGGDHHRAQDVTQMVFVNLARKAAALVRHPVLPAWLYRSSCLEAADARRREWRRQKYERAAGAEANVADSEGEAPDWKNIQPVLDQAMNELNERDRQAVLLRFFSDRPFAEVGRQLGLTENAARMRVDRALARLHERLGRRGITSSSAALAAALAAHGVMAAPAGVAAAATGTALASASGAAAAWIALMTSTKLPLSLTAALVLGGAGVGIWQGQIAARTDRTLADLAHQNGSISTWQDQNQRLIAAAERNRQLQDDAASLDALMAQVGQAEIKVAENEAAAKASRPAGPHARSSRVLAISDGNPAFEPAMENQAPARITVVPPPYPFAMRQAGVSGQVIVDFVIGTDGTVYNAEALSSTNSGFEDSAVQAISQWTFKPGQNGGQPVNTHMQIPLNFSLGTQWL